jgi:hypothetical protein
MTNALQISPRLTICWFLMQRSVSIVQRPIEACSGWGDFLKNLPIPFGGHVPMHWGVVVGDKLYEITGQSKQNQPPLWQVGPADMSAWSSKAMGTCRLTDDALATWSDSFVADKQYNLWLENCQQYAKLLTDFATEGCHDYYPVAQTTGGAEANWTSATARVAGPSAGTTTNGGVLVSAEVFDASLNIGFSRIGVRPNVDTGLIWKDCVEVKVAGFGFTCNREKGYCLNTPVGDCLLM